NTRPIRRSRLTMPWMIRRLLVSRKTRKPRHSLKSENERTADAARCQDSDPDVGYCRHAGLIGCIGFPRRYVAERLQYLFCGPHGGVRDARRSAFLRPPDCGPREIGTARVRLPDVCQQTFLLPRSSLYFPVVT